MAFRIPTKRPPISSDTTPSDVDDEAPYNSDEGSINLDKVESEYDSRLSSNSLDDSYITSSCSEVDMDVTHTTSGSIFFSKDKTKWTVA